MGYFNHSPKSGKLNDAPPPSSPFADLQAGLPETLSDNLSDTFSALQWLGMASALVGAASLGLYIGRELRLRYKFHRRTPSDFFSNAGDPITNTEYGMGI
jgi:hypothetical protein